MYLIFLYQQFFPELFQSERTAVAVNRQDAILVNKTSLHHNHSSK